MNLQEALKLPAGLELDTWVAERVLGYVWRKIDLDLNEWIARLRPPDKSLDFERCDRPADVSSGNVYLLPFFSTSIEAAWQVIEKLRTLRSNFGLSAANSWRCSVWNIDSDALEVDWVDAAAETAALAICRCGLKATWKD
jgi:hypothetical protein